MVDKLVVAGLFELVKSSTAADEVAESLVGSFFEGTRIEGAVLRCLMEHERMEEVFADEQAITEVLRRAALPDPVQIV